MKKALSQSESELLDLAATKGPLGKALIYTKLSGPGWLQGATTLGGGSLAGALYLGILFGPHMLWLQPLAMICGVIMLCAINYVVLSTGERPFGLVMRRVSPFLAWAWIFGAIIANMVFILPQFSLATAAIQQNIFPQSASLNPFVIGGLLFVSAALIVSFYNKGGKGIIWFERVLQIIVGLIVLSFVGVTITLIAKGAVNFAEIFKGHIPNLTYFNNPTPVFSEAIAKTGENASHWTKIVTADHSGRIISAFGTAVGINMTFLLPYSILKRNWGKKHRGLALFDLSLGLVIPFVIATGCLVIAAASQFHGKTNDVIDESGNIVPSMKVRYEQALKPIINKIVEEKRAENPEKAAELLTLEDKKIAAMLASRDTKELAAALEPLTGEFLAQKIFGLGVLGMAYSTIIVLMLINGFCATEALGQPQNNKIHIIGAMLPGIMGFLNPIIWTGASKAALIVPVATIAGSLIPIAYYTFFLLMNSKAALGSELPSGSTRITWTSLMLLATTLVSAAVVWVNWEGSSQGGLKGTMSTIALIVFASLFIIGTLSFLKKSKAAK